MKERIKERFKELCEHAEVVDDSTKLKKLCKQIDRIIDTEVAHLKKRRKKPELTALRVLRTAAQVNQIDLQHPDSSKP